MTLFFTRIHSCTIIRSNPSLVHLVKLYPPGWERRHRRPSPMQGQPTPSARVGERILAGAQRTAPGKSLDSYLRTHVLAPASPALYQVPPPARGPAKDGQPMDTVRIPALVTQAVAVHDVATIRLASRMIYLFIDCFKHTLKIGEAAGRRR